MIAHAASTLNAIVTKFTVLIYHSYGNVYQQFCKPVKKYEQRHDDGNLSLQRNLSTSNSKFAISREGI
jgi:hypothetical protein